MTPEEIKKKPSSVSTSTNSATNAIAYWLKEIAYQLAVMNEKKKTIFVYDQSKGDPR